jgi:cytochrome c oxidase assembly protein subunit 15
MVFTGGITRLTNSGLSMVNWNFILGSFPPVTNEDWIIPFEKYKSSPEFKLINYNFTLSEFKNIFWWEYIHRFIGRSIGLVFLVPYAWFIRKKMFTYKQFRQANILLLLGLLQGFIGWYMVKSGLNTTPHVSHYRLALHLGNAFLLYAFAFSFFTQNLNINNHTERKDQKLINILLLVIFMQVILGAFVSGLKAGLVYNTYPFMNGQFIPNEIPSLITDLKRIFTHSMSVQFLHRMGAIILLSISAILLIRIRNAKNLGKEKIIFASAVVIQLTLGIMALLLKVPVWAGVLHQAGAFLLLTSVLLIKNKL